MVIWLYKLVAIGQKILFKRHFHFATYFVTQEREKYDIPCDKEFIKFTFALLFDD